MLSKGLMTTSEMDDLQNKIKEEIDEAVDFAENSDFPAPSALYDYNYSQPNYPFIKD
jgi:pyruvate dehydrogenase E1 component alpha subunit